MLLDSGNLAGDLISAQLAEELGMKISGATHDIKLATKTSQAKILGYVDPFLIFIEGIKTPCMVYPRVLDGLAHPMNLGELFMKRHGVRMTYDLKGVQMEIHDQKIPLQRFDFSLYSKSTDPKFHKVLSKRKRDGKNPVADNQIDILRINHRPPIPGLNVKTHRLEWIQCDLQANYDVHVHQDIIVEPSTSCKVGVYSLLYAGTEARENTDVYFAPAIDQPFMVDEILPMEGVYNFGVSGQAITVMNVSTIAIKLHKHTTIGTVYPRTSLNTQMEEINVLSHKPASKLTEAELAERTAFIKESLQLESKELLKGHPEIITKTIKLFLNNFDALSVSDDDFGKTDLVSFQINLKPDAKPFRDKVRPLAPQMEEKLKKQIADWLRAKIIEPAQSPWSSALVPVKKKDSNEVRWAIDFRKLNEATVADAYPLPRIDTTLTKLRGSKVYSSLDSAGAFHAISVEPESRPMTAFSCSEGQFQFVRLPFGVTNGPSCYSRLVQKALSKLPEKFALAYIDDIIIYSKSVHQHYKHLEDIVRIHARVGMKLKLRKCALFESQIKYLGFMVSENGISMVPEYVAKILDWELPITGKMLRSFLGFAGYYRSFIPKYAELTSDLESMKSQLHVNWTPQAEKHFNELKDQFTKAPTRGYPDYESEHPFILDTDFSSIAIAAVLSQVQNNAERFLGCVARKCKDAESRYPSYKGELLAFVYALQKFEHMLLCRPFLLRTDSSPLKHLDTSKKSSHIFNRWHAHISQFRFSIVHRPGKKHVTADALSRREGLKFEDDNPKGIPPLEYADVHDPVYALSSVDTLLVEYMLRPNRPLCNLSSHDEDDKVLINDEPITHKMMVQAQKDDKDLRVVYGWLRDQFPPYKDITNSSLFVKTLYKLRPQLKIHNGLVKLKPALVKENIEKHLRLVVPHGLRIKCFYLCHNLSGHRGMKETVNIMRQRFYFPNMNSFVAMYVNNCSTCLKKWTGSNSDRRAKPPTFSSQWGHHNQCVYIDTMGPFHPSNRYKGQNVAHILTMMDGFTRFLVAEPIPDTKTSSIADAFYESYVLRFGCPSQIHSDNGTGFTSKVFREITRRMGIYHTFCPPYNPSSNKVERSHQSLMKLVRTDSTLPNDRWADKLQPAVFLYNSLTHSAIGVSPFQALYGKPPQLPIDYLWPVHVDIESEDFIIQYEQMRKVMEETENLIRDNQDKYALSLTNSRHKFLENIKKNDIVYYFLDHVSEKISNKLQSRFLGPFKVVDVISDSVIIIQPIKNWSKSAKQISVNVAKVRKIDPTLDLSDSVPKSKIDIRDLELQDEFDSEVWIRNNDLIHEHRCLRSCKCGKKSNLSN